MSGRAVVVLSLAAFASAAALRATDPLLPLLAETFGTTAGGASAVITAFAIGYGLLQVVMGPIGDRIGKYRMVFVVTAISAAGNLACAFAPSLPWLVAARFVTGATVGAIVPLSIAWIGDSVAQDQRQQVLARFLIGHMIGIALAATASGWLGERHGWPAVFFALTALYVVIAVLLGIVASLGSALFFMMRDRSGSNRMVKALAVRVGLSVALFVFLMAGYYFGLFPGRL